MAAVIARLIAVGLLEATTAEGEEALEQIELPVPGSSCIRSIGYRGDDTITVTFIRGGTYTYSGDKALFLAFAGASSKGTFFNEHFQVR
jgi:hypothetical protein